MDKSPYFSIILSTRDRPEIFLEALNSVVRQSFDDREIIVVVDGSSETNLARYRELMEQFKNITFLELLHRPNGHGQSYTMNYGVHKSTGKYLCFLDDDDYWADDDYLARLHHSLVTSKNPVEVHYSNQRAVHADGTAQHLEVWLEGLIGKLGSQVQHTEDCYFVSPEFLLGGSGFAHLNCTVFERNFYTRVGGMDENIRYENDRAAIDSDDIFRHISMSAPYLELVEELTMPELLQFQQQFKPFLKDISADDVISISRLGNGLSKHVRHFSSGMKQRLKVALAVLADVPVVLLDEPTTNLDEQGVAWYLDLIKNYGGNRLIIVCSNTAREYSFCSTTIDVLDFK